MGVHLRIFRRMHMSKRKIAWLLPGVLFMLVPLCAAALRPMKHMEVMVRPDGAVVFVKPRSMLCVQGGKKAMEYDVTMSTLADSAFFTCTVMTDAPAGIDSVAFRSGSGAGVTLPAERIYAEPKSDRWVYRLRCALDSAAFADFSSSAEAPCVEAGGKVYRHKQATWNDCREVFKLAKEIIDRNK